LDSKERHKAALQEEAIQALAVTAGGRYIDCTAGAAGHSAAILEHSAPGGQLLAIDADPEAIELTSEKLKSYGKSFLAVNDNFSNLIDICQRHEFYPVHGILFDLGLSSMQLEASGRGFSFRHDASLDMRFNPAQSLTAADIVNSYQEEKLADIIWRYGEEKNSRHIARAIFSARPLKRTLELAEVVAKASGGRQGRLHPATRTFQALRIAVNDELNNLKSTLNQAVNLLGYQGRLVVISYHSLEDRIVKRFMGFETSDCICPPRIPVCTCSHTPRLRLVNKKVVIPNNKEIVDNPRSRSARLRAAEKLAEAVKPLGSSLVGEMSLSTGLEVY